MLNPAIAARPPTSISHRGEPAPLTQPRTQADCLRFTTVLFAACLFLQRFALPVGASSISLVGPLGLALAGWGLARGALVLDRTRTLLFAAIAALAVLGAAWHTLSPGAYSADPTLASLAQFLVLTSFATLSFAEPVSEPAFFARISTPLAIVAALGIAQFAAQFAGIRLFAFTGLLPDRWLMEAGYNLVIPVGVGDVLKSNGLVLIEPSVFSQFMALGLMIEMLTTRRLLHFALFAAGLLLSFSGTGMIVLACFFLVAAPSLGARGIVVLIVGAVVLAAAGGIMLLAAPDFATALSGRFGELSQPGTSGHLRFVTPFWLIGDILARTPSALFAGIGAGVSERLDLPYAFDVNTPVKIFVEYGLPLLILYLALFARARRSILQGALFAPLMLQYLFTGGYQQFPPVLFAVLLLTTIARLRP